MKNIILLGAPGAGKGTLATALVEKLSLKHISTGDLLREVVASGSSLGAEISGYMKSGALVPDALIGRMLKEAVQALPAGTGALLDGFPRTIAQADMLAPLMRDVGRPIDAVYYLSVDLDQVVQRLVHRVSCASCGRPYHLINLPPQKNGVCDACGGNLVQREDDKEDTIRKRYTTFLEKTQPLIDYYSNKKMLTEVPATTTPQEVLNVVLGYLKV